MASFDEHIVREYFELHGFLVRQVRKYSVQSRKKREEEEIDLLVYNPSYMRDRKPNFLLFSSELPYVHRAVVAVKPWHTIPRFTPRTFKSSTEILKFLEKNVVKKAEDLFRDADEELEEHSDLSKLLVIPGIPTQDPQRSECISLLQGAGVDGIISFRSMLQDIINKVEVNLNYQKSEVLHIFRLLKNYDLLKEPQLELFKK